jgi:hypothetical protein
VEIPESMAMEAFKNGNRALGDELHVNIKIKS